MKRMKVVVGVGGASGSLYASVLLERLRALEKEVSVGLVLSPNARLNWEIEMGRVFDESQYPFDFYAADDFMAPFASGSAAYEAMIVCPCSMGLLGRIAQGISTDLISRAADVMLKEQRRLVLVPRETPYSLIHLENMRRIALAGGIICPASPSFYSRPKTFEQLAATVVDRVLQLIGLSAKDMYRWGEKF